MKLNLPPLPRFKWPQRKAQEPKGQGRRIAWLVTIPATATLLAACVEAYWAWIFCVEATGTLALNWDAAAGNAEPGHNTWNVAFSSHIPILIGLVAATVPIVMWSMIWLPAQMEARGTGRWRRVSMIAAGLLCNALVIVSGTVVMNANRQDHVRAGLTVEQTAAQGVAAIDARLSFAQTELARLTDPALTTYQAQAARDGATAWAKRTGIAAHMTPPDPQLSMIAKAQASAEAADTMRSKIEALTVAKATAAPPAATQANVRDDVGAGINTFAQYADAYRPPFVAFTCTLIGIFGAFWLVGLIKDQQEAEATKQSGLRAIPDFTGDAHRGDKLREMLRQGQAASDTDGKSRREVVERQEVVFDENGHPMIFRKAGYQRNPKYYRNADPEDATEYESAARVTEGDPRVSPDIPTNMAFEAGGPQEREDARSVDNGPSGAADDDSGDGVAAPVVGSNEVSGAPVAAAAHEAPDADADADASEQPPAPLPAAEFDRLVAIGAIAEDGTPLSQEDSPVIEQEDRSPKRPMLAAPVLEAAK